MPLTQYEQMMADPLGHAMARLPDAFQGPTHVTKLRTSFTSTPAATTGLVGACVFPDLDALHSTSSVFTGSVLTSDWATLNFTQAGFYSDFNAASSKSRILNMGVRVSYIGLADNRSGRVAIMDTIGVDKGNLETDASEVFAHPRAKVYTMEQLAAKPAVIALNPFDRPVFAQNAASQNAVIPAMLAFGEGLPNTNCLNFEIVVNVEYLPLPTHHEGARPQPANQEAMDQTQRALLPVSVHGSGNFAFRLKAIEEHKKKKKRKPKKKAPVKRKRYTKRTTTYNPSSRRRYY